MPQPITVKPGAKIRLSDFDANDRGGEEKGSAIAETEKNVAKIDELAFRMYAENRHAILLVLQGMDTSGKDGVIRKVMNGLNPQICQVTSFKCPSQEELEHDFLWRIHREAPRRGNVGIFNRSHYEDVLVVRVHDLAPEQRWKLRYDRINEFEKGLVEEGTEIIKVFLHISKDEQRKRLDERLADPTKRWKFNVGDLAERKLWDAYQAAYEDALTKCNTAHAPWHIVPAGAKWYRNLIVSRLLRKTLEQIDPQFPQADKSLEGVKVE